MFLEHDLKMAFDDGYQAGFEAAQPKWISVKERLPEPEKDVLVLWLGRHVRVGWYSEECNDWKVDAGFTNDVTHWMPLPEAPKEEA